MPHTLDARIHACLTTRDALDYLADNVSREASEAAEAHVENCPRCQELLDRLAVGPWAEQIEAAMAPIAPLPAPLLPLLSKPPRVEVQPSGNAPDVPGYELIRELGRGGSGVVYLARDLRLGRMVALKLILDGRHASPEELARFRSEAYLIARLRHPHLVRIHHVGELDGVPYCAMEYLEGGNLRQRLAAGPLPPREAAALAEVLAEAIRAVHAAGVVHRDLKPENILLDAAGSPRVADFGLARDLEDARTAATRASQVIGTPRYMAPEQAAGRDERNGPGVDIHAIGLILYEMLTGAPPFGAATLAQTLAQVVAREPTPPRRLVPDLPLDLATVCLKCLEKEPARRYATAGALAEDLRRFLDGRPVLARPVGPLERLWRLAKSRPMVSLLMLALGALVLTLAVGGPIVAAREARLASALRRANAELRLAKADADAKADTARRHSQLAQDSVTEVLGFVDRAFRESRGIAAARKEITKRVSALQKQFAEVPGAGLTERLRLARARLDEADACMDLGALASARTHVEGTLPLLAGLASEAPGNAEVRAELGRGYAILGQALGSVPDEAKTRAGLTGVIRELDRLARDDSSSSLDRARLAGALAELAYFEARRGRREAADEPLARTLDFARAAVTKTSFTIDSSLVISRALWRRAAANLILGRTRQARRDARSATDFAHRAWVNMPYNPKSQVRLAAARLMEAKALEDSDATRAEMCARGSLEVATELIDLLPGLAEPIITAREACQFLERLLRDRGRDVEADLLSDRQLRERTRRVNWPDTWPSVEPDDQMFWNPIEPGTIPPLTLAPPPASSPGLP